jgi:hypothetical protein
MGQVVIDPNNFEADVPLAKWCVVVARARMIPPRVGLRRGNTS